MAQLWDTGRFGCINRDGFRLRPKRRTELSTIDAPPTQSKKGDVRAPIEAQFSTTITFAQFSAFTQWHRFDLAGGARAFQIDLWMWGAVRRVTARFLGTWKANRQAFDTYALNGTFEIERESIP